MPAITDTDRQQFQSLIQSPAFLKMPDPERKKALRSVALFKSADEATLNGVLAKIGPAATDAPPTFPKPESALSRVPSDLQLGFRRGVSEAAQTLGNVTGSKKIKTFAKKEAPTPEEMAGRDQLLDTIAQGIGELPGQAVKYAPAFFAKKYAPAVAGVIGAAGAADQGLIPALKAGARDAAGFYLQEHAATLPTRLGRSAASAVAMGVPTLIESKGDPGQTAASAILGGAMGAVSAKPKPGTKSALAGATAATSSLTDDIAKALAPVARDKTAAATARIARAHFGEAAARADQAEFALRDARNYFDSLKPGPATPGGLAPEAFDFIDNIEKGQIGNIPQQWQPYAKAIRKAFDERGREMQSMGLLRTWVDDYFPHLWKKPQQAAAAYQAIAKRPFEGSKSFLKQRKFASLADGLKYAQQNPSFQMELVTKNPIDMALLQLRQMDKLVTARKILEEMKGNGLLKFYNDTRQVPPGYTKINDRVSTVMFKSPKSGMWTIGGYYFAPEPATRIINNYLSPGLSSKDWFRRARVAANVMNQFQLGWSAFHLGFTTFDAMMSNIALGTEKIVEGATSRKGKYIAAGLKDYAKAPFLAVEPLVAPITGKSRSFSNQIFDEWMKPGTHPNVAPIVEYAKAAGARVQLDPFYKTAIWRQVRQAYNAGKPITAALKVPFALNELAAKPIMEYAVPRQKIAAFARLAEFEMSRMRPGDSLRGVMQKAWDSVDNRMGQLVYDNLFWDKTAKELLMTMVRSVGWNLGTFRELGGGVYDLATVLQRIQKGDRAFTHRMAYTLTLPMVAGMMGAVTNYLNTRGTKRPDGSIDDGHPQGVTDLFYPRTGQLDENGHPERISFPTYMNDVSHWVEATRNEGLKGAGKVLAGKAHPMIAAAGEIWQNADWRGQKIRNEDDPAVRQLYDLATYLTSQAMPFSARYLVQDAENKARGVPPQFTPGERVGALVGIRPAPSYIKQSDAEKYLDRNQRMTGPRTREAVQRFDVIRGAERAERRGQDPETVIQDAVKRGEITDAQADQALEDARKRAAEPPLVRKFRGAAWDVALNAYRLALEDLDRVSISELTQLRDMVQEKVYGKEDYILSLPVKARAAKIRQIHELGLKLSGETTATPPGR